MYSSFKEHLENILNEIRDGGLFKNERVIEGPQDAHIDVNGREVLNMCANNYLGLSDHTAIIDAAQYGLERWGYGLSSVRFICGTQAIHKELERKISEFLGTEDTILYTSCFDANGGLFETLLGEEDAVISDELNHASIIDGVRLCKAQRFRYKNSDMADLEAKLEESKSARFKMIATDGVFSMDGYVAKLKEICGLADRYSALVLVDDCHATGHLGEKGRGTPALTGAGDRVDIVTGTFGKTLGGGMGGFVAAAQPIVDLLRQRARPYLFSNSLAPPIAAGALKALEIAIGADARRALLKNHARRFREGVEKAGFKVAPGETPIIPVMLGEARLAQDLAHALDERGVFVAGFFFPVVPKGAARIRTQMSAALTEADIDFAIGAFSDAGKALGIVS